jgi:5'-3' exonuclease
MELLLDGDLFAFSTAIALQRENPFLPGEFTFDQSQAEMILASRIDTLATKWKADKITIALSCQREENFRMGVTDTYKAHRKAKASPIGLVMMRDYLLSNYSVVTEPHLEADDIIGILATDPSATHRRLVVSWDKDVTAIEGETYNPQKDVYKKVSKLTSLKFFLYQCLIGDSADGYKGINKIGPKKGQAFISGLKPLSTAWEKIVELAMEKGHGEKEEAEGWMLIQARLAWILRNEDYNWKTKEIKLWTPERISDYL